MKISYKADIPSFPTKAPKPKILRSGVPAVVGAGAPAGRGVEVASQHFSRFGLSVQVFGFSV